MSKRKREMEKAKKQKARQVKKQAKAKREKNDPVKWEEKKEVRQIMLQAKRDAYPNMSEDCKLPLSKTPSPLNCSGCEIDCPYNRHY